MAHFIVHWRKHYARRPVRWLVTSIDTDQLIVILLAMSTGVVPVRDIPTDSKVKVVIKRVIHGQTDYLYVNRIFDAMCALRDGSESAWPKQETRLWLRDKHKARQFVLVYHLSGCDFLPAIRGMGLRKLWTYFLKALRPDGLFPDPVFVEREGKLRVDIDAGIFP